MEHDAQNEGRLIWRVAVGTILFTAITSTSWHLGEMRVIHEHERKEVRTAKEETARLAGYRDALASGGTTTAKTFLDGTSPSTYGF